MKDRAQLPEVVRMPTIPRDWTAVLDSEGEMWLRQGRSNRWRIVDPVTSGEKAREQELIYEYGPVTRATDPRIPVPDPSSALSPEVALERVLVVLDDWIQGAKDNHEGMGHRGEPVGGECWSIFHPADIRSMVNDAARDLGLTEPWKGPENHG